MFAKLKENKLFKSFSEALCSARKAPAKESGATGSSETKSEPDKETEKTSPPSA